MKLPAFPVNHDLALLVLRLWLGIIGVFHGGQKLFGLFGGHGLKGFSDYLASMNVPAPSVSAVLAALAEFAGGILVAIGLVPRAAAIPFFFTMIVAWATGHHFAFDSQKGGGEYALTLAVALLVIIIAGPGKYAITRSSR